jgi:hypothetical protein
VGRAQDNDRLGRQHRSVLSIVNGKLSFHRRQRLEQRPTTRICLPQDRDNSAQARPRRLRREVGRAQDNDRLSRQHRSVLSIINVKPSFHRRQRLEQQPTTRICLPQDRDNAAQARPRRLRREVGRAQDHDRLGQQHRSVLSLVKPTFHFFRR